MPSSDEILSGLREISVSWQTLAVLWHVYFGVFALVAVAGLRLSNRAVAAVAIPPLASVGVMAWVEGNPFNGAAFSALSMVLVGALWSLGPRRIAWARPRWLAPGLVLAAFGWGYPHFLEHEPASAYLYAAPLGLIPCPSLSMAVGITMMFGGFGSRAWSLILASVALFYGIFGAWYLGVTIDWILAGGGVGVFALGLRLPTNGIASAPSRA